MPTKWEIEIAKGLEFVPQTHIYTVGGVQIPSVTTILKKSDVYSDYAHVPEHTLMRAADIGTNVHKAVEDWVNYDTALTTKDNSDNAYLDGFVMFIRENDFEPLHSEIQLYDPDLWYAGTVDLWCRVNGALYVCDIKTTNKLNKEAIEMQLAAYKHLIEISLVDRNSDRDFETDRNFELVEPIGRAVIWLKKTGTYKFHIARDPSAWMRFKGLL
jgi:hypothetical protein